MKTHANRILDGLSVVISALVLSAILALLVLLIILFPAISRASADERDNFTQTLTASDSEIRSQSAFATDNTLVANSISTPFTAANTTSTVNKKSCTADNTLAPSTTSITTASIGNQKSISANALTTAADPDSEETVYGLIGENVILYDGDMQPITGLPATYFVIIIGEDETHYQVTYRDLSGYAEKLRIFKIDYEPRLKFGLAHFSAQNDTHPVIIREKPTSTSNPLSALPHREKTLYYGAVTGEALIPAAGNLWYYVNYEGHYGYVYSAQGSVEPFAVNPGDKVIPPAAEVPPTQKDGDGFPDWAFILLLSVPAVIIMLALFGRGKSHPRDPQQI